MARSCHGCAGAMMVACMPWQDPTFTLLALMNAGYAEEAKAWRGWLIRALGGEPALVQVVYGPGGERHVPEHTCHGFQVTPARSPCASAMRQRANCSWIFMAKF